MSKNRIVALFVFIIAIFFISSYSVNGNMETNHYRTVNTDSGRYVSYVITQPVNMLRSADIGYAISLAGLVALTPPSPAPSISMQYSSTPSSPQNSQVHQYSVPPPTTTTRPQVQNSNPTATNTGAWLQLRICESGNNYSENTGNGYYGAYQFSLATWQSLGLSGLPSDASPSLQDQAAAELEARGGWGQWPACALRLGL